MVSQLDKSNRQLRREGLSEQQILQIRSQKQARDQQLTRQARDVEKQIESNYNQFSNISQVRNEINKLPKEIQSKINLKKIEKLQEQKIKRIEDRIKRADDSIKRAKEDERQAIDRNQLDREIREEAKQEQYKTEKKELQKFLPKLKSGEILNESEIIRFARDKGQNAATQDLADSKFKIEKQKRDEQLSKQLAQGLGDVTSIKYKNGQKAEAVLRDGTKIKLNSLNQEQLKNVQLSAIREAAKDKQLNKIKDFIDTNLNIRQLKERGLNTSDISLLAAVKSEFKLLKDKENIKNKFLSNIKGPENILDQLNFREFQNARRNIRQELNKKTDFKLPTFDKLNSNDITNFKVTDPKVPQLIKAGTNSTSEKGKSMTQLVGDSVAFFLPILRKENAEAVIKLTTTGEISRKELSNIIVDAIATASVPLKVPKAIGGLGKVITTSIKDINKGSKIKNSDRIFDVSKSKSQKLPLKDKIKNINKKDVLKFVKDYSGSVVSNVALADATTRSAEKAYGVSDKKINDIIKKNNLDKIDFQNSKFTISNDEKLYQLYRADIAENSKIIDTKTGKITLSKPQYYLNMIGLDTSTAKAISKAQQSMSNFLINQGVPEKDVAILIAQLENKRRASIIGDIVGNVATEFSSEALGQNLIKRGVGKNTAVFTAGTREALSELSKEAYIRDADINPIEFAALMGLGGVASIYYSKQKFKSLKNKKGDKILKKASKSIVDNLNKQKRINLINKNIKSVFKASNIKIPAKEIRQIRSKITKKQADKSLQDLTFQSLKNAAEKKTLKGKEKLTLRSIVANVVEPFEIAGDVLQDLSQAIAKRSKGKYIKRKGVKTLSLAKTTTPGKSKTSTKTKPKTKTKSKPSTKTKTKPKTKTKSKPSTKTKTKPKTKTKAKTKVKTKTKPKIKTKVKTKPRVRIRTVTNFPPAVDLPKTSRKDKNAFLLVYTKGGRKVGSKSLFPENRAIKRAIALMNQNKNIKKVELQKRGKTNIKDIADRKAKGYQINKLKTRIDVLRSKK